MRDYALDISEVAQERLIEAAQWYEQRMDLLGVELITEWEYALDSIISNPLKHQIWNETFRQHQLESFPYLVIFEVIDSTVVVHNFIHAKRHPGKRYRRKR
ncbi:MAG: hypothetical protein ACKVOR_01170 [Flavobacteriales bacterium]